MMTMKMMTFWILAVSVSVFPLISPVIATETTVETEEREILGSECWEQINRPSDIRRHIESLYQIADNFKWDEYLRKRLDQEHDSNQRKELWKRYKEGRPAFIQDEVTWGIMVLYGLRPESLFVSAPAKRQKEVQGEPEVLDFYQMQENRFITMMKQTETEGLHLEDIKEMIDANPLFEPAPKKADSLIGPAQLLVHHAHSGSKAATEGTLLRLEDILKRGGRIYPDESATKETGGTFLFTFPNKTSFAHSASLKTAQ